MSATRTEAKATKAKTAKRAATKAAANKAASSQPAAKRAASSQPAAKKAGSKQSAAKKATGAARKSAARTRGRAIAAERTGAVSVAPVRIREAADQFVRMFDAADAREQQLLVDAVSPDQPEELDEDLFGPAPSTVEVRAAELSQLRRRFADRRRIAETALTREEAAELLGVTAQAITDYLAKGQLVGIKNGRAWVLPSWEFDPDVERGIVPGIARLRQAFPGGVVSLTRWVTRPSIDLGERTPRDALAAGDVDKVIDVASTLTAAGW
jgi:hypothetical protein